MSVIVRDDGFHADDYTGSAAIEAFRGSKRVDVVILFPDGRVSDDPTIGTCWDADRLDLRRVAIVPKTGLMSTNPAKGSAAF